MGVTANNLVDITLQVVQFSVKHLKLLSVDEFQQLKDQPGN